MNNHIRRTGLLDDCRRIIFRTTDKGSSLFVGMSMAPRGEVALVIAGLVFFQGHISHDMFVALILVTIGTVVLSPIMMAKTAKVIK